MTKPRIEFLWRIYGPELFRVHDGDTGYPNSTEEAVENKHWSPEHILITDSGIRGEHCENEIPDE